MSCERFAGALDEYAVGGQSSGSLERHLAGCAACRARLANVRQRVKAMDDELAAALSVDPSPDLAARVRSRIVETPAASFNFRPWALTAISLTAAIGVALVAAQYAHRDRTPHGVPTVAAAPAAVAGGHSASVAPPVNTVTPTRTPDSTHRREAVRRGRQAVEPEVIVPSERADALHHLMEAMAQRRLQSLNAAEATIAAAVQDEIAPLTIQPIPLPPLEIREPSVPTVDDLNEGAHRD